MHYRVSSTVVHILWMLTKAHLKKKNKTIASGLHYPEMSNYAPKIIVTKQKDKPCRFLFSNGRKTKLGHVTVHSPVAECVCDRCSVKRSERTYS